MNKPTFHKTVNILVQAYLNDTLRHEDCSSCAVGTLLLERAIALRVPVNAWANLFVTCKGQQFIAPKGKLLISSFGDLKCVPLASAKAKLRYNNALILFDGADYSIEQYQRIEYGFETAPKGNDEDEWIFNGLMAVVDILAEIHNVDLSVKEQAKLLFAKP